MLDTGHIDIDLRNGVAISTTRPANIGRVFVGKTPDEVKKLVPLLFVVCAEAQQLASRMALATARGEDIASQQAPKAVAAEADTLLQQLAGAAASVAGRLLRQVQQCRWAQLGVLAPHIDDAESSCFTLVKNRPGLSDDIHASGDGLEVRLVARLAHAEFLIATLRGKSTIAVSVESSVEGAGSSTVETARGLLVHRVSLAGERIAQYEILAPTDRNFGNGGPLSVRLAALMAECDDEPEIPARLLVDAFDPCVGYSLRVY